jgi:hypothetical protein
MEPEGSLPCPQQPTSGPYPEPGASSPLLSTIRLKPALSTPGHPSLGAPIPRPLSHPPTNSCHPLTPASPTTSAPNATPSPSLLRLLRLTIYASVFRVVSSLQVYSHDFSFHTGAVPMGNLCCRLKILTVSVFEVNWLSSGHFCWFWYGSQVGETCSVSFARWQRNTL